MARSSTTNATGPRVEGALRSLVAFAWMARRVASIPVRVAPGVDEWARPNAASADECTWLLHRMAKSHRVRVGHPDQTANRDYTVEDHIVETPSHFTDGAPVNFEPGAERAAELAALVEHEPEVAVQHMIDVLHPLAHAYADGRATYATSEFNNATRALRDGGWSLDATEAKGASVWVRDGMGDSCSGLTSAEAEERDRVRGGRTESTPF